MRNPGHEVYVGNLQAVGLKKMEKKDSVVISLVLWAASRIDRKSFRRGL